MSALGWSLIEATRPGRFDVEGADALGVPNGPERGALQRGEAVTLADGRSRSHRSRSSGPPRPGRKLVVTGDTAPSDGIVEAAWGADVLVTEATFSDEERERAEETRHQTATQAAEVARRANVGLLALTHLSNRYFGGEIAREAREIFPETVVPRDFDVVEVPYAERGTPQLIKGGASHRARPRGRIIGAAMTDMVRVAVAGDVTEAEEIQEILRSAGIDAELGDGEDDSVTFPCPRRRSSRRRTRSRP